MDSSETIRLAASALSGMVTSINEAERYVTLATSPSIVAEVFIVPKLEPETVTIVPAGPEIGDIIMALAAHIPVPLKANVNGSSSLSVLLMVNVAFLTPGKTD